MEIGLSVGDEITVNILGRDITATIAALREVEFENAGIGFILTMSQNALAGAPHTHIATVYAEEEAEAAILRDVAGDAPNITAIRVRDAIDQVAEALRSLAAATSYGAAATLITGFIVLIGAAAAGNGARVRSGGSEDARRGAGASSPASRCAPRSWAWPRGWWPSPRARSAGGA
jgi:putative ABC transport system permease protein